MINQVLQGKACMHSLRSALELVTDCPSCISDQYHPFFWGRLAKEVFFLFMERESKQHPDSGFCSASFGVLAPTGIIRHSEKTGPTTPSEWIKLDFSYSLAHLGFSANVAMRSLLSRIPKSMEMIFFSFLFSFFSSFFLLSSTFVCD